jgi:hypothetical protein
MRKRRKKTTQKPNKNHYTMRIKKKTAQNERKKPQNTQIYNNQNTTKNQTHPNIQQHKQHQNHNIHKYTTTISPQNPTPTYPPHLLSQTNHPNSNHLKI